MLRKDIVRPLAGDRCDVDPSEVAKFDALAEEWWKTDGKFKVVHAFNAARVNFLIDFLAQRNPRTKGLNLPAPLSRMLVLDAGSGAGLVSLPLAAAGAIVTGIDASARSVAVAKQHAAKVSASVSFKCATPDELAATNETFDAVICLEVVEHVADLPAFLKSVGELVAPGGSLVLGTLNRTLRSYALAIVGAEYVLRWLPRGTHDWWRFVTPDELITQLAPSGFAEVDRRGVNFNPLTNAWRLSTDTTVNYLLAFEKHRSH